MAKTGVKRLDIGTVGKEDRKIVDYLYGQGNYIYMIECLRCGNKIRGMKETLDSPCKKCSYLLSRLTDIRKYLYDKYKYSAQKRGYEFSMTYDAFCSVIVDNCFYCGKEPSQEFTLPRATNNSLVYSGVDRIDNSIGYTNTNIRPCCKECNRIKWEMSIEEFKNMVTIWSQRMVNW